MTEFVERIRELINAGEVRISEHGYDELADDRLTARDVVNGIQDAVVVEEYPNYPKGYTVLLLQRDKSGMSIHVVWGIPRDYDKPVVLVTAYRPDRDRWDESFMKRR
ncbi:MAG: DUF4258 domain-containing protein [Verrucomicrobia bacterium]|nr:DUF4258 domain-containing protein [Verrucomicrobiota bacterium]MCF7709122.1 DUF4258 domain-containing protein [Verrucomicrobiota bacterium]